MFVVYMHCKATDEGDRAGYVTAYDPDEVSELDYILDGNECIWFVPKAETGE